MIIGSVMGPEEVGRLEAGRIDEVTQVVLDEITSNPIIDEQIRKDPIIMRELRGAAERAISGEQQKGEPSPRSALRGKSGRGESA